MRLLGRTAWIEWFGLFIAAGLLAWGLAATRLADPVDALIHDAIVRASPHTPDPRILIVAIDDASIRDIGLWPWSRDVHAQLIDRLSSAKAAAVGYDVLFVDPAPDDAELSASIVKAGIVALPLLIEAPGQNGARFSIHLPAVPAATTGQVIVRPDTDGILRRVILHDPVASAGQPHLALEIARLFARRQPVRPVQDISAGLIPFAGYPGSYATVSFASVLRGEVPAEFLHNRIVLVGWMAPGLGDRFATPIGGERDLMAGVEVQANIVDALLNHGMRIDKSTTVTRVALALAVLLPLWLAFLLLSPRANLTAVAILVVALLGGSATMLIVGGFWIGPGAALITIMVMFPLWGWRRLAAASRFLDVEIARLGGKTDVAFGGGDRIGRQIATLDAAGQRIDTLRQQRDETLAFLSHDLRSPAAAILAIVPGEDRIAGHARRLLRLADQFVQSLRAEEAPLAIEQVEPCAMLDEVADHCWEAAARVGGRIHVSVDPNLPLISTDRALMARALTNLVENALKYGGEVPTVFLRAWFRAGFLVVTVADSGPGIPTDRVATLFDRFDRGGVSDGEGIGLGLSLVAVYARRQEGQVRCFSRVGVGTQFVLTLPVL